MLYRHICFSLQEVVYLAKYAAPRRSRRDAFCAIELLETWVHFVFCVIELLCILIKHRETLLWRFSGASLAFYRERFFHQVHSPEHQLGCDIEQISVKCLI